MKKEFFSKKNHGSNISRKELIDSVELSIKKNKHSFEFLDRISFLLQNQTHLGLSSITITVDDFEDIEYLKVVCSQIDKMYKDTLKRMGVYYNDSKC